LLLGLQELPEPRVNDEAPPGVGQLWETTLGKIRPTAAGVRRVAAEVIQDCATRDWTKWLTTSVAFLAAAFAAVFLAKYSGWGPLYGAGSGAFVWGYVQAGLPLLQSAKRHGWRQAWLARRAPACLLLWFAAFGMGRLGYLWDDSWLLGLGLLGLAAGLWAPVIPWVRRD
jgi:hypothetical protein